ncbi:MAG: hypothetical protein ACJAVK_000726 [Akkermansiaceae bacterium]|jgi:hypothetical protein
MRKNFPAPKGLGSRSYADRYAESRSNTSSRKSSSRISLKKFLPGKKPLNPKGTSLSTTRSGWALLGGISLITTTLWIIMMVVKHSEN